MNNADVIDLNTVDLDTLDLGSYQFGEPVNDLITQPGILREMLPATRIDSPPRFFDITSVSRVEEIENDPERAAQWQEAIRNSFEEGGIRRYESVTRLDLYPDSAGNWHLDHNSDGNGSSNRSVAEQAMIAHFQNESVQRAQQAFMDNMNNVIMPQVDLNFSERAWLKRIYDEWQEPLRAPEPVMDFHVIENGMIRLD